MMGPAHSLSGAAAWLGVGAAAMYDHHPMPWPVLVVGMLLCAGAALGPDLDHKPATISRAFGPLSRALCEIVEKLSLGVYHLTRKKGDPRRDGGHRTLTHTWPWAALCGAGSSAAAVYGGRWGVLAVLFVHVVLAIDGLLWWEVRGHHHFLVWLLGAAGAWFLAGVLAGPGMNQSWLFTQPGQHYLWLGLPVALGSLVHCIGDALTVSGCPVLWPIPIGRKRWYPVGTPHFMRFHAGSWVEVKLLMPLFVGLGGLGGAVALGLIG
jgi:LexA-binding, inner membrane-associated putative hydrolase